MNADIMMLLGEDVLEPSRNKKQKPRHAACSDGRVTSTDNLDLQREVAAFIAALPYPQRTALLRRLRHKLGYAEIADDLGCAEHEARATVHDVVRSLRTQLGDRICANPPP